MQSDDIYEAQDVDDMSGEATGEFDNGTPSEEELQSIVGSALDDAVDFIDNTISPLRATSIDYYQGKPFGNEEDGRSQVISLDVHDTIADILPSLMRIFFPSENVVEFVPRVTPLVSNLPTVPTPVTFKSGTSIPLIVVISF